MNDERPLPLEAGGIFLPIFGKSVDKGEEAVYTKSLQFVLIKN